MQRYDKYMDVKWLATGILLLFAVLHACQKDDVEIAPSDEELTITFSAKLPNIPLGLKTYALSDDDETWLRDVDVLVFTTDGSDWKFRYRTVGKIINQSVGGGVADIEVKLWKTEVDSRLVILANARQQLRAYPFVIGETIADLQANLVHELGEGERWAAKLDDPDNFAPLPMWAEYDIVGGINAGITITPGTINLLRSLARIDVLADAVSSNFILTNVYVYNSKRNGLMIPNMDNLANGAPSLPASLVTNDNDVLEYGVSGNKLEGEIYLFEAASGTGTGIPPDLTATALVIRGYYTDSPTNFYYYRIDFKDASDNLMPLLRNHRYVINIVGATSTGTAYTDKDLAFEGQSLIPRSSVRHTGIHPNDLRAINYAISAINETQ